MKEDDEKCVALHDWLRKEFQGADVQRSWNEQRECMLFRVRDRPGGPYPELEVMEDALEDYSAAEIIADFERFAITKALKNNPAVRLRYTNDRRVSPV